MEHAPLGEKERQLVSALQALGPGWHSRAEIAAQLKKRRLNPAEVVIFDVLVSKGKVEKRSEPGKRANISQWVYKLK